MPHILDPKFNGECLSRNERIKKISPPPGKGSVLKSDFGTGPTVWWRVVCDDSKLAEVVVSLLNRAPTAAATERSFFT